MQMSGRMRFYVVRIDDVVNIVVVSTTVRKITRMHLPRVF